MTQSGNNLLGDQSLAADRTLLALGQAGLGAGGSNGGDDLLGVTQSGNNLLGDQSLAADRTLLALGQAGFGAGGSHRGDDLLSVTQSSSLITNIALTADGAGEGGIAALGTGGSGHNGLVAMFMGYCNIQDDLRQGTKLHTGIGTPGHAPAVAVADLSVAADAVTGKAAHLHKAVQGQGGLRPVLGDGHGDHLGNGAEIILAVGSTAGVGIGVAKLILIGDLTIEVILGGELLSRVGQAGHGDGDALAGLQLLLQGDLVARAVGHGDGGLGGSDHLIACNAVLLQTDDVAAGGQAGNGDLASLGVDGHTLIGKRTKGQFFLADGAAIDGDGDALLGNEGNACTLVAVVELRRMLGIEDGTVAGHVALDGGAVLADTDHEHAGTVGPDGGEPVGTACAAQTSGGSDLAVHGIIGHQNDGGTLAGCGHGGCAGVVGIGDDRDDIVALNVDDLVLKIGNGDFIVGEAVDGLPIAEHVQSLDLADIQIDVALIVDVHVDVAQIEAVVLKITVDRICIELAVSTGIVHKQHLLGDGDGLTVGFGGLVIPVGDGIVIGILDTDECIAAQRCELVDDGVIHILHLDGLGKAVGEGAAQSTSGNHGTGRSDDGEVLEDQGNLHLARSRSLSGELSNVVAGNAGGCLVGEARQGGHQEGVGSGTGNGHALGILNLNGGSGIGLAGIEGHIKGHINQFQIHTIGNGSTHADDALCLPANPGDVFGNLHNAVLEGKCIAFDSLAADHFVDCIENSTRRSNDRNIVSDLGVLNGQIDDIGGLLVLSSLAVGGGEHQHIGAGNVVQIAVSGICCHGSSTIDGNRVAECIAVGIGKDGGQIHFIGSSGGDGFCHFRRHTFCQCGSLIGLCDPEGEGLGAAAGHACAAGLVGIDLDRCHAVDKAGGIGLGVDALIVPVDTQVAGGSAACSCGQGKLRIPGGIGIQIHGGPLCIGDRRTGQSQGCNVIIAEGPIGAGIDDSVHRLYGSNIVGVRLAAASAGTLHKIMAQSLGLVGNIAVAALAGVSGVTTLGAGGNGHSSLIAVGMGRFLHGDAHATGSGADLVGIVHTVLACHGEDVLAGIQHGGVHHQLTILVGGTNILPVGYILRGNVIGGRIVNIQAVGVQILGGTAGGAHVGTGVVQSQGDLLALDGIHIVGGDVVENAVGIGIEAPAGEVTQGDDVTVPEQDLVRSGTPALGGQRILVVNIVVQVAVAAPELVEEAGADTAADGEHLGADQTLVVQIALTCLVGIDAAVEDLKGIDVQVKQRNLAFGILSSAWLKVTAGQSVTVVAVALGDEVVLLQSVQCQVEVRNGNILHGHDGAAAGSHHKAVIRRQGQNHIHGRDFLALSREGRNGDHSQNHDKGQDQGKHSFHIHHETSLS